jgi:hypothetical protein
MKIRILALCFLLLCFTSVAVATESFTKDNTQYLNYEVADGYVISNVYIDNIKPDFNCTAELDSFGETYILMVNCTKSWGWWYYDISLKDPNGNIETTTLKSLQPYATDTDVKIQYFTYWLDNVDFVGLDVDVYVGILPLVASFTNPVSSDSDMGELLNSTDLTYTRLSYSNAKITCNQDFDAEIIYVTPAEFQGQIDESILEMISGSTELFFDWAWDSILAFVEMIPGVGPYLASALEMSAFIVGEVFFYLDLLFIEYPETTILTIEFLILAATILKTDKKSSIWDMAETYISMHKAVIEFFYNFAIRTIELLVKIVQMVADIVGAIKPL